MNLWTERRKLYKVYNNTPLRDGSNIVQHTEIKMFQSLIGLGSSSTQEAMLVPIETEVNQNTFSTNSSLYLDFLQKYLFNVSKTFFS